MADPISFSPVALRAIAHHEKDRSLGVSSNQGFWQAWKLNSTSGCLTRILRSIGAAFSSTGQSLARLWHQARGSSEGRPRSLDIQNHGRVTVDSGDTLPVQQKWAFGAKERAMVSEHLSYGKIANEAELEVGLKRFQTDASRSSYFIGDRLSEPSKEIRMENSDETIHGVMEMARIIKGHLPKEVEGHPPEQVEANALEVSKCLIGMMSQRNLGAVIPMTIVDLNNQGKSIGIPNVGADRELFGKPQLSYNLTLGAEPGVFLIETSISSMTNAVGAVHLGDRCAHYAANLVVQVDCRKIPLNVECLSVTGEVKILDAHAEKLSKVYTAVSQAEAELDKISNNTQSVALGGLETMALMEKCGKLLKAEGLEYFKPSASEHQLYKVRMQDFANKLQRFLHKEPTGALPAEIDSLNVSEMGALFEKFSNDIGNFIKKSIAEGPKAEVDPSQFLQRFSELKSCIKLCSSNTADLQVRETTAEEDQWGDMLQLLETERQAFDDHFGISSSNGFLQMVEDFESLMTSAAELGSAFRLYNQNSVDAWRTRADTFRSQVKTWLENLNDVEKSGRDGEDSLRVSKRISLLEYADKEISHQLDVLKQRLPAIPSDRSNEAGILMVMSSKIEDVVKIAPFYRDYETKMLV